MAKWPPKRKKPDRAPPPDVERVIISVSVEKDLVNRLDIAAKREARTRSAQVALLIRRWLEEEERA